MDGHGVVGRAKRACREGLENCVNNVSHSGPTAWKKPMRAFSFCLCCKSPMYNNGDFICCGVLDNSVWKRRTLGKQGLLVIVVWVLLLFAIFQTQHSKEASHTANSHRKVSLV